MTLRWASCTPHEEGAPPSSQAMQGSGWRADRHGCLLFRPTPPLHPDLGSTRVRGQRPTHLTLNPRLRFRRRRQRAGVW